MLDNKQIEMTIKEKENTWNIKLDGFFKKKIEQQLIEDDFPKDSVDKIFHNCVNILSNCPNPCNDKRESKTGIVIGKVQSGKTSNFISLLALAFDNKYNIAIVFGGNKNNLLAQNADRIKKYFKNVDTEKLVILTTNQNEALINSESIERFIKEGRKVIIVGLKHSAHINAIATIFNNLVLRDEPTLIIDDEGDQATLNTEAFINGMSSTYQSVIELKKKIYKHCFISITATPQANILIDTIDMLSPDFGVLVYPGEDYCGLQDFHGEKQDKYIKTIPENEPSLLEESGVPFSFYKALATFFIGGALRKYRGDNGNHAMLIHPSEKKVDHQVVIKKVSGILEDWRQKAEIKLNGNDDISYDSLKRYLIDSYEELKTESVKLPEFNEIEKDILDCISRCSPVLLCNSDEDASNNAEYYRSNIFVGGNMVERGITIKGLAVTYIIRRSKGKTNIDNVEQRARWFGYKRKFLDVCRVYTTSQIKDDFSKIYEHDEELWGTIERAKLNGIRFKDIPRIFVNASKMLNLTRRNVARAERFNFSEWTKQNYLELNKERTIKNIHVIDKFRNKYESLLKTLDYGASNKHVILENIDFKELKKDILDELIFPEECNLQKEFFLKLDEAIQKIHIDAKVDIIWIRDIEHETRSVDENGKILSYLFQGYNSKYIGDANLVNREKCDRMQLQIHFIKPKDLNTVNFYCPALALYIPFKYSEKMSKLEGKV